MTGLRAWLVHTPIGIADSVEGKSKIVIGWNAMGDLSRFKTIAEMREKYQTIYGVVNRRKVAMGAGNLYAFSHEIKNGDFILTPLKVTREILIGKVVGDYFYNADEISSDYPNLRSVSWMKKVPRDNLSQPFRNTIGGLRTVFNIDAFISEINDLLSLKGKELERVQEVKSNTEPPFHERVQSQADDMIADLLSQIDPFDFQYLAANLLRAMGFNVKVGEQGPDGGVDIIAHPDVFGFQSPRIKVQVKHRKQLASAPEIQQLAGAAGQNEALFISTGGFTSQAYKEAEKHPRLALVDRDRFIELILEHYERLDPEFQSLIPLKKIYVPTKETS